MVVVMVIGMEVAAVFLTHTGRKGKSEGQKWIFLLGSQLGTAQVALGLSEFWLHFF